MPPCLVGDTTFPKPERSVRLLPEYDVYVMGFRERDQLVPEQDASARSPPTDAASTKGRPASAS